MILLNIKCLKLHTLFLGLTVPFQKITYSLKNMESVYMKSMC